MNEQKIQRVHRFPLFSTLPYAELKAGFQAQTCSFQEYEKGSFLHMDGDTCSQLEFILSGQIIATRIDLSGDAFIINQFGEADCIGATLLFASNPEYPMTLTVTQQTCIVTIKKSFIETALKHSAFQSTFLQMISDQAVYLGNKIKFHMNKSIRDNISLFLQNEYYHTNNRTIQLNMSKKMFAEKIGVQRTSLSRELDKMRAEGLILFDRTSITLLTLDFS